MAEAGRDNNYVSTALLSDGAGNTEPLRVDPATGYVLIDVVITSATTPPSTAQIAPRDNNFVPVSLVVEDGSTVLAPLVVDTATSRLLIDMTT